MIITSRNSIVFRVSSCRKQTLHTRELGVFETVSQRLIVPARSHLRVVAFRASSSRYQQKRTRKANRVLSRFPEARLLASSAKRGATTREERVPAGSLPLLFRRKNFGGSIGGPSSRYSGLIVAQRPRLSYDPNLLADSRSSALFSASHFAASISSLREARRDRENVFRASDRESCERISATFDGSFGCTSRSGTHARIHASIKTVNWQFSHVNQPRFAPRLAYLRDRPSATAQGPRRRVFRFDSLVHRRPAFPIQVSALMERRFDRIYASCRAWPAVKITWKQPCTTFLPTDSIAIFRDSSVPLLVPIFVLPSKLDGYGVIR